MLANGEEAAGSRKRLGLRELADRADQLAREYLHKYFGCSQTVLAAVADALGLEAERVFKAMVGLAGGVGITGWGTCGALAGAAAAVSLYLAPDRANYERDPEARLRVYQAAARVAERFKAHFGAITCWEVQVGLFGKHFDLRDPEQLRKFLDGGFIWRCEEVVGLAARWAVEAIAEAQEG